MTTYESIERVFIQNPEKWLTGQKVRKLAEQIRGEEITPSEFYTPFIHVRDNLIYPGKQVVKFNSGFGVRYTLTDKKVLIANHNRLLNNGINRNIKRKIA